MSELSAQLHNGIAKGSFVVLGRAGMDLYADPIGVKAEFGENFRADLGGSSANICAGLCKLGMQAALVTSLSDDTVGRFIRNKLIQYGVDVGHIRTLAGEYRSSLAVYESVMEDFQVCIYRNNAVDFQVTPEDVADIDYGCFGALVTAGTVFAAEPSRSATFAAFDLAKKAGVPIIFDIDYRPYSWPSPDVAADVLTRAADASAMIVGNDEEFGFMAGAYERGLDAARGLAARGKLVIYKMGAEGAITMTGDQELRTGTYPATPLKPVGAGDSFMAATLAALANGASLADAVDQGAAAAAITVSHPGCAGAMPDRATLSQFIEIHQ